MKKKAPLEADLDPAGTRHTRPGSKIADVAVRNAHRLERAVKKRGAAAARSNPAGTRSGTSAAKRKRGSR